MSSSIGVSKAYLRVASAQSHTDALHARNKGWEIYPMSLSHRSRAPTWPIAKNPTKANAMTEITHAVCRDSGITPEQR